MTPTEKKKRKGRPRSTNREAFAVATYLTKDQLKALDEYADKTERNRSWVLRKALEVFLAENK